MADNELYKQQIVIEVTGDESAKVKLKAMDNYLERTSKRAQKLGKAKVSPTVHMNDKINWPLARTLVNLKKLTAKSWKVTVDIKDHITGRLKNIRGKIWSMTKNVISSPLTMLGIGGGLAGVGTHSLKLSGEAEQAGIAFETMLGNARKARSFIKQMERFAIKTPFEMPQLRDSVKLMLAYQFEAKKTLPYLRIIGDTASGLSAGAEGIEAIVRSLGQMKQTGRVNAQDMMQLTNVGIAAWQILADKMGKSVSQVRDLSEKGLIPADKAVRMLLEGMDKGTKNVRGFGGLMAKQARSMFGLFSTIKDFFNLKIFTKFGQGLSSGFVPAMERFVNRIDKSEGKFKKVESLVFSIGRNISTRMVTAAENAYKWFEKIASDSAFKKLDFSGKMSYLITSGTAKTIPIVIKAGVEIGLALAKGIFQGIREAADKDPKLGALIGASIPGPWPIKLGGFIAGGASGLVGKMQHDAFMRTPEGQLLNFSEKIKSGKSVYKANTTLSAPKHALGGIFTKPHIAQFAEDGPEAIIPLGRKRRSLGIDLWQKSGEILGLNPFSGGFSFPKMQPSFAGAGSSIDIGSINVGGITVQSSEIADEEALAYRIGRKIVAKIKKALENRD